MQLYKAKSNQSVGSGAAFKYRDYSQPENRPDWLRGVFDGCLINRSTQILLLILNV